MGARGNSRSHFPAFSPVFLSVKNEELTGEDALAFQSGVEVAYKAVMRNNGWGTIATVSRGAAIRD